MKNHEILAVVAVLAFTLISGFADSRGFLHASRVWHNGQLDLSELTKSALGFAIGIMMYWSALRFLPVLNIALSAEIQTLGWFCITIVGIAISSGEFIRWNVLDKVVGVMILIGLAWLLFRGR